MNNLPPIRDGRGRRAHDSNTTSFTSFLQHHSRGRAQSESPQKGRIRAKSPFVPSSAERKARRRPTPLNLDDARKYGEEVSHRKGVQAIHFPLITPADAQHRHVNEDGSSSVYTDNSPFNDIPTISPLHINKRVNVFQSYNTWRDMTMPNMQTPATQLQSPAQIRPARSKSVNQATDHLETLPATTYEPPATPPTTQGKQQRGLVKSATAHDIRGEQQQPSTSCTDQFSPLTPWLMGDKHKRKASKTLFGNNGWLDDSGDKKKIEPPSQKPTSFLDGIKKKAREFAETANLKPARRLPSPNRVTISLDPREQSLLYCELEFILSNALDLYIKSQLNGGRLDPDKLKKVADVWSAKGRPRVVGFRYDLETQLELISLHVGQFRFYGHGQINESATMGLLGAMKSNARTIRVRTLCQPDSVIAKQILDSQALLQLIGSTESLQISLAEVSQFFKVVLEREKAVAAFAETRAQ
ncbi:hypothetical protein BKA67DRAFT_655115 [Truncatella angustata]|uniref:Uncharacterized protein n=1 Tax=Truncatella angustata TaxID=152316 RepID=A0A9P8URD9_9PEZI|nr:uncharacterized protein BKA67DRAFT_655115 [Truncatella angustata]KAH6656806.1 hypothetical protein BKA67DRAFT_655115 [Truncatella angustata]